MNKTVYGVYTQGAEVVQAINSLKAKGYEGSDITVVANHAEQLNAAGNFTIDKDVKTVSNDEDSFLDKVMKFFDMKAEHSVEETMRTDYGFTPEESARYAEQVKNGHILVLIDRDAQLGGATEMNRTGQVKAGANTSASLTDTLTDEERRIKLREERLHVDKNEVRTGEVVVKKDVTETQKEIEVPVEHEEVYIERRKGTDHDTSAQTGAITDNEEIRIPVTEEKIEVTKKPVVTDKIVIGKEKVTDTKTGQDTVKKEDVHVDKNGNPLVSGQNRDDHRKDSSLRDSVLTDEEKDGLTRKPLIDTDHL